MDRADKKAAFLTLRITKELKRELTRIAKSEDRTVSYTANRLLAMGMLWELEQTVKSKGK